MILAGDEEGVILTAELQNLHTLVVRAGSHEVQSLLLEERHNLGVHLKTMTMTL